MTARSRLRGPARVAAHATPDDAALEFCDATRFAQIASTETIMSLDLQPPPAELAAEYVIGNYDYYHRRWEAMARTGKAFSFNWAAFFLTFAWGAYRKMYLYSFLYVLFIIAEATLEVFLDIPDPASHVLTLVFAIVTGGYANLLYLRHVRLAVASVADRTPQDAAAELRRRGGVSLFSGVAAGFLFAALLAGIVALAYYADASMTGGAPA